MMLDDDSSHRFDRAKFDEKMSSFNRLVSGNESFDRSLDDILAPVDAGSCDDDILSLDDSIAETTAHPKKPLSMSSHAGPLEETLMRVVPKKGKKKDFVSNSTSKLAPKSVRKGLGLARFLRRESSEPSKEGENEEEGLPDIVPISDIMSVGAGSVPGGKMIDRDTMNSDEDDSLIKPTPSLPEKINLSDSLWDRATQRIAANNEQVATVPPRRIKSLEPHRSPSMLESSLSPPKHSRRRLKKKDDWSGSDESDLIKSPVIPLVSPSRRDTISRSARMLIPSKAAQQDSNLPKDDSTLSIEYFKRPPISPTKKANKPSIKTRERSRSRSTSTARKASTIKLSPKTRERSRSISTTRKASTKKPSSKTRERSASTARKASTNKPSTKTRERSRSTSANRKASTNERAATKSPSKSRALREERARKDKRNSDDAKKKKPARRLGSKSLSRINLYEHDGVESRKRDHAKRRPKKDWSSRDRDHHKGRKSPSKSPRPGVAAESRVSRRNLSNKIDEDSVEKSRSSNVPPRKKQSLRSLSPRQSAGRSYSRTRSISRQPQRVNSHQDITGDSSHLHTVESESPARRSRQKIFATQSAREPRRKLSGQMNKKERHALLKRLESVNSFFGKGNGEIGSAYPSQRQLFVDDAGDKVGARDSSKVVDYISRFQKSKSLRRIEK